MGVLDGVSRAVGITPRVDRVRAEETFRDMEGRADDPASRFGVAYANDLMRHGADDASVRRAFPQAGALGSDPAVRRSRIAEAARDAASVFIAKGDDHGLGPDLGRAVREREVGRAALVANGARMLPLDMAMMPGDARTPPDGFAMAKVSDQAAASAGHVERFLETSSRNEQAIGRTARVLHRDHRSPAPDNHELLSRTFEAADMSGHLRGSTAGLSEEHVREATFRAVARSRAGLVSPDAIVKMATDRASLAGRKGDKWNEGEKDVRRVVPDFRRGLSASRDVLQARRLEEAFAGSSDASATAFREV